MKFWITLLILVEILTLIAVYANYKTDEILMLLYSVILVTILVLYKLMTNKDLDKMAKLDKQVRKLLAENDEFKQRLTKYEKN